MDFSDTITIITGIITRTYVDNMIQCYKTVQHKLISTWDNSPKELIEELENNGFIIFFNPYHHADWHLFNYQYITVKYAIEYAIKLGYKYICRTRTDVYTSNHNDFLTCTRHLYQDKVTVICGVNTQNKIYFLDVIIVGKSNELGALFNVTSTYTSKLIVYNDKIFVETDEINPEVFIFRNYTNIIPKTKDDIKKYMHFCKDICIANNITIFWISKNMQLITDYCNNSFVFI
jgi:hypothetical protein